jgi:predicted enzyme related to lactoylglutathione lyase
MIMTTQPAKIGNVQHPVGDVPAAVRFYTETFGFTLRFADGDRYAALDAGGATLALTAPAEDLAGGVPAAAVKVADVPATLRAVTEAGGTVLRDAEPGGHEVLAVVRDPWRNTIIIYGPAGDGDPTAADSPSGA